MREITFHEAVQQGLAEMLAEDSSVFVIGEAVAATGVGSKQQHPLRVCDARFSLPAIVGMCAGAAASGSRPVIRCQFGDALLDAAGQLLNRVARTRYASQGRLAVPLVLQCRVGIGDAAGYRCGTSCTPFLHAPGLRVVLPSNAYDAKGLLKAAIRSDDPVLFLEHRLLLDRQAKIPENDYQVALGKASIVQTGTDVTVVALGRMVQRALDASRQLTAERISVEVIDPRTLSPLDCDTIFESVRDTGRLLIVDESPPICGVGAEISAHLMERAFDELDAPVRRVNGAGVPTPYSPQLERAVVPKLEDIARAIRELAAE